MARKLDVNYDGEFIKTTITHDYYAVAEWLNEIQNIHHFRLHKLIVGLDIEWRPNFGLGVNNPVAILQLCVGRKCLIYQLCYNNGIPQSLVSFLNDPDLTFVGVAIQADVSKLMRDFGLGVLNAVNLQELAADVYNDNRYLSYGLKSLTSLVLNKDVDKPRHITLSDWSAQWLSDEQVAYACIDAFLCFEIGRVLKMQEYY